MLMEATGFFKSHILGKESETVPGQVRNRLWWRVRKQALRRIPLLWAYSHGFRL